MEKRRKRPLNCFAIQLPLLFFVAGFSVILMFSGVIYFAVSDVLLEENIDHTKSMLNMSSVNISTYIDRLWGESSLFANDPDLKAFLANENGGDREKLEQRIRLMLENDPCVKSIVAVSKDGRILSNEKNLDMSVSEDMMQETWYINAMHADMPVLTGARMQSFSADKDNWVISVSTEVTDASGENAGVLVMDMKYSVIEELLQSLDLGQEGSVFLLNEEKEPVYHKDTSYFADTVKQQELIALMKQGDHYERKYNLLTAQVPVENAGWTMVAVVYLDKLQVLQRHLFETVLFSGGLLFVMMLVIGKLFSRRLTRRIRELREELSHNEENLRQLEIQALTDQINPHFLYNTLDTIVWMAEFNDSTKVIALTKSLAAFFRISLSGGREIITVEEELEHVRQYLFIQKERYEDKLSYDVTGAAEVLSCFLPKLILQPLVENSIYHGIRPMDRPGHIAVYALQKDEKLHLTVSDDGAGFDMTAESKHGVGLRNVQERIALYYGTDGSVEVTSERGRGCTVTIIIGVGGPVKNRTQDMI